MSARHRRRRRASRVRPSATGSTTDRRRQIGAALVFGGLLFVVGQASPGRSRPSRPEVAALLVGTIPIWIVLLDRLFFGGRLQASAYVGLVLGFVGLGFLFDPFGEGQSTASARSSSCSAR